MSHSAAYNMTDLVSYKKNTRSGILFCYQYILIYALHYHVYKHVLSLLIKTFSSLIVRNVLQLLFTLSYLYLPLLTCAAPCLHLMGQ